MFYPKNITEKLGLDQVIETAIAFCETEQARQHYSRLKLGNDKALCELQLNQTNEVKSLLEKGELNLLIDLAFDIQKDKAHVRGFHYDEEIFGFIRDLLHTLQKALSFFQSHTEEYPNLSDLFKDIDIDFELIKEIDKVIGPDGQVKPNASKKLQKITSSITSAERSIIKSSNSIFNSAKEKGILAETELGIKNGRVVLPVLSEYKRKVSGVLIDQSGTGKISYIEPLELVALNNDLAEFLIQKRQEIIAILKELTAKVVVDIRDISKGMQKLAVFDFIRSKARLAIEWKCILPKITNETVVDNAVHPLLRQRLSKEKASIVPIDYALTEEQRIIVISGPNAGGKSVALKTVGLLQIMFQAGFLVPCNASSKFRIFEHIFVDIGDNQSIESDLSTYSSHLKAAKHIVNFSTNDTLVLMDEIGTGTDPMFGGPMAEAVLEEINRKRAYGIITTHFSNIKAKAEKLEGVVNAAMLFDIENLLPLYKFLVGQPGSSFVYEVAANIGLNKKLIKRAKQLTNTKQYDLDKLLAEVQSQKEYLDSLMEETKQKAENAELFEREYKELKNLLEKQKKDILAKADQRANSIIKAANKDIEKTIRDIQESKADKAKTKAARKTLTQKRTVESPAEAENPNPSNFKVGDKVQIADSETVGEIVELKKNKATLAIGNLTTKTAIANLHKVGKQTEKQVKKYISNKTYSDRQANFSTDKDIRGMRTYDALKEVDEWIDSALILGVGKLRLLHGKGNGILKMEVRRHLKPNPAILSIEYERVDLGGEGISIIELK